MKTYASPTKRPASAMMHRRTAPSTTSIGLPAAAAHRAQIRQILEAPCVQAKLTIGSPNDKYEQEADRVAEQVMRMPEPKLHRQPDNEEEKEMLQTKPLVDQITPLVQRQEEPPEDEEEELVQAKSVPDQTPEVVPTLESKINRLEFGGHPLDLATRSYFEPRFGTDFSHVRVHSDSTAADAAKSINARAFTLGNHVVMAAGEYQPRSQSGRRLLGHELVHSIQSGNQIRRSLNLSSKGKPWTKAQLQFWLDSDLRKAAKSHESIFKRLITTDPSKKGRWKVESSAAKGKYRLGMAVLRMFDAGVTDAPPASPAWLAIHNPDDLKPRQLLDEVYRVARGQMERLFREAAASPAGKEAVEQESAEKARSEKGYKYIFADKPHKKDESFADERERAIVKGTAPHLAPPVETPEGPEEERAAEEDGTGRRLRTRPWFRLVDEKSRTGSVSILVYGRTPLIRNDKTIEEVTEIAFRLENPIIYGQSISIPPIVNTGRLGCTEAVPLLVEYELGLSPIVSDSRVRSTTPQTGADGASHYWLSGVEIIGVVDFTIYIANDLDTHVCGVGLNHDFLLNKAYNEVWETEDDLLAYCQELKKDLALMIGVGQSMAIPVTGPVTDGRRRFIEIMNTDLSSVCEKYQSGFREFEPRVIEVP